MKRKVNRVGQNTLTVSLPSKWAKRYAIRHGDEVDVIEEGRRLIIGTGGGKEDRKVTIAIDATNNFMNRMVCGPYLKGYDTIELNYKDKKTYGSILGSLQLTIGFEITSQGEGKCRLEEISTGGEENLLKLIYRLFHVIKTFGSEVRRYVKEQDDDPAPLFEMEAMCDRLSLHLRRLINKDLISGKTYDNTAYYHITCLLEQIGDEYRQIIEEFEGRKGKAFKLDPALDKVFGSIDTSLDLTLKKIDNYVGEKGIRKQVELAAEQKRLRLEVHAMKAEMFSTKGQNVVVAHHLLNIVERIQHMSEELF